MSQEKNLKTLCDKYRWFLSLKGYFFNTKSQYDETVIDFVKWKNINSGKNIIAKFEQKYEYKSTTAFPN